jgi:hypothetical protein
MCKNDLLARCLTLVDDQFETVRATIMETPENRAKTIDHDGRLLEAIIAHDSMALIGEMVAFLDFLQVYYMENASPDGAIAVNA